MSVHPGFDRGMLSASFDIRADSDPGVACRVLGYFAQLDLVPSRVRICAVADELHLRIVQPALAEQAAEVIAAKLRSLVPVRSVSLEHQLGRTREAA